MKIGIFGDSFAQSFIWPDDLHSRVGKSWSEVLSEKYDVTNFGLSGSSTYYSYDNFVRSHSKFDKVIFISSEPGRITLPKHSILSAGGFSYPRTHQICGYADAEKSLSYLQKNNSEIKAQAILEAAKNYYLHIENILEEQTVNNLYEDTISKIRPDSLVLSAFVRRSASNVILSDISAKEINHWGISMQEIQQTHREIRRSHMTEENNLILAGLIDAWISTNKFNISLDMFLTPDDWQRYFYKE